jgi:hypothetical protein
MSSPAALAIAKLFWPETKEIRARSEDAYQMDARIRVWVDMCSNTGCTVRFIMFEYTKGIIRSCRSKTERQYNNRKTNDKRRSALQSNTEKPKD